jgi:hypothetical protein
MVVGFTITYAISAYHHWYCEFKSRSGRCVQHYVIKFVSDFRQVGAFLRVVWFPPPIKLKYCWKWRKTPANKQTKTMFCVSLETKDNIQSLLMFCSLLRVWSKEQTFWYFHTSCFTILIFHSFNQTFYKRLKVNEDTFVFIYSHIQKQTMHKFI